HTVATGGCYLTPDIAVKLAAGRQDPLTKRERQVAEKLAQGMALSLGLALSPLSATAAETSSSAMTAQQMPSLAPMLEKVMPSV
ncbi:hypothetical protein MJM25_30020, partial [Salmonella enterica subsp. enterica serovar Lubbock]|nr:hypothetical protein [Salmonella enterica subsp. enterica serovar Lubbock]